MLYVNDFAAAFSKVLDKTKITCYQIHQFTHLDQAYLSRLKNGERKNPSPETIVKIGLAICHLSEIIKLSDIEMLFSSVGRSIRNTD
jgi:transcriptional regulator with XRE-family HTH domain